MHLDGFANAGELTSQIDNLEHYRIESISYGRDRVARLAFNIVHQAAFKRIRVRHALAYAIDREVSHQGDL